MSLRLQKGILRKHQALKSSSKRFNILLVDDEQENLDSLSLVLDKDYNLLFAKDGAEALDIILRLERPEELHMIVSDQRMPNMTGVGLFKRTRELLPNAVRIILTGYTDVEAAIASINEGNIYKFLTKPIDPIDLRHAVRRGLEYHIKADEEMQKVIDLKTRVAETESIVSVFEKFVPRQFTSKIATEGLQNIRFGRAESESVTILFADIRGFSGRSASMTPQDLLNFLNECFKRLGEPVHKNGGFVDKYIGDSVMALFDSPGLSASEQALNAARAALQMQQAIDAFNEDLPDWLDSPVKIGIGMHTGPVVIGTVGMESRMDLTVLGDSVNVAAHLERLNDDYGSRVILSEQTHAQLADADGIRWRELDRLKIKGQQDTLRIFELVEDNIDDELLREYGEALRAYLRGDWSVARQGFTAIRNRRGEDGPSRIYLERCDRALASEATAMGEQPAGRLTSAN